VSSDPGGVAAFSFTQLDAPPTVGAIGDALAVAHREAEKVRESARKQGHAEGYAAGLALAREQSAPAVAAIAQAATEFAALRETVRAEVEQDAIALAFDLAEQIVAAAVAVEPERVLDVARHALRHLIDRRQVTLVVNPDDLAVLNDGAAELKAQLGGIDHLAVQADRRVERGGAIARTEAGEIDAGLPVQLARAREIVADALADELPDAPALTSSLAAEPALDALGPDEL
jgi:flagellar assembly protein FliH